MKSSRHVQRRLIALALMLQSWALVAGEPQAPASEYRPNADLNREAQQDVLHQGFTEPVQSAKPEWPRNQYDPRPAQEATKAHELTLPMPCGGSMVFRRIEVGGNGGWLGEQQIELGSMDDNDAPVDGRRLEYIAGTFSHPGPGPGAGRHYYLGKYEVTELQFRVLSEPCPQRLSGRRPAVKVSWYDAVDFTRRYTEWLHQNASKRLPQEDGVRGYLRLPTEVEWEYAARGGLAVGYSEFQQAVFPTKQGSIDDYAWIRESVASSFEPHPVGSLRPNPLGLYDTLGNASELVFDLFRLSVRGRVHAQPGGFLVKGGHFRSWRKAIRNSWRREHPHFSPVTGMPNRLDTVGFRVAISAPMLTSEQRVKAIHQEWKRLSPAPTRLATAESCRDLAAEVRSSLGAIQANLERCLADPTATSLPAFLSPPPFLAEPPAELPTWSQVWDHLPSMETDEIRQHGLWFLQAHQPDSALVLLKEAVARGDGWSALVIGAMYDPLVFEAQEFGPGLQRIGKPRADAAVCWYRVAKDLGEKRAGVRIEKLAERGIGATQNTLSDSASAHADCEKMTPDSNIP